ncbi:MAG: pyruvate kinase [Ignavibacteriales bacterium]|nr:pyruvate kinase [Ignavibacteriales bacterium]
MDKKAKTKIIATYGPAIDSRAKIKKLVLCGVNTFRLNFSHGTYEQFRRAIEMIRDVSTELSKPIAILQDLQGPKLRLGELEKKEIKILTNDKITITTKKIIGNSKIISTIYKKLVSDISIGDRILIDDGIIQLKIIQKENDSVVCKILSGGILKPRKSLNFPDSNLTVPSLTQKDIKDLHFGLKNNVDFIALSFVRSANDIIKLKKIIKGKNKSIPVIAKIEKPEAVKNFEEILKVSDGIMIARGDLGVEMQPQEVPLIQKMIINRCNSVGKLVITATQMLESMINNPIPTRAEANDVANAVWDGTDVVMLSGETSVGRYPMKVVKMMSNILLKTEASIQYRQKFNFEIPNNLVDNLFDATGRAYANIADQINADAIIVFTHHGRKAKVISKFRPNAPIYAVSEVTKTLNELSLFWGICPFRIKSLMDKEKAIKYAKAKLANDKLLKKGNVVMFTAGAPFTEERKRSWVKFSII